MERMKILVVGCIFLFSIVLPSIQGLNTTNINSIGGNIITVDNEGDGDYTSIRLAVKDANPNDTIEVYSGTYYEHGIKVEKEGITIQGIPYELGNGSDTGKPFIDGEGIVNVFELKSNGTTIDNFLMENGPGTTSHHIIVTSENAIGCTISNNDLYYSSSSIIWCNGPEVNIIDNNIGYSTYRGGIGLRDPCDNSFISGNNITHVEDGILMWGSTHHTISGNRITNCSRYGVDFATGDHTDLEGNHIEGNNIGIQMCGRDVDIKNNNFLNNGNNILYISSLGDAKGMFKSVRFEKNYYDNYIGIGPKLIWGYLWLIPIAMPLNIDWHPAKEPYDI